MAERYVSPMLVTTAHAQWILKQTEHVHCAVDLFIESWLTQRDLRAVSPADF
jgi:hypothetical protein